MFLGVHTTREFWMGAGLGTALLLLFVAAWFVRRAILNYFRRTVAERLSRDFVAAAETLDLLRVSESPWELRDADFFPALQASLETHSAFFQRLLNERARFRMLFGTAFDVAFDDMRAIYVDFVQGCEMLQLYREALAAQDVERLGPHRRFVCILFRPAERAHDVTWFRLTRAAILIDSTYAPILAERARKRRRIQASETQACPAF